MQDVEHVPHAAQLAVNLIRLVAQTIPNYWHQCMPPEQTAAATEWADGAIGDALHTLPRLIDSPDDRARVIAACIFLPLNIGGLGFVRGRSQRASAFAATFVSVWPTCRALCPALATAPVAADSPLRTVAAFCSAWEQTRSLLASVRVRYAALDRDTRVWVDGTTQPVVAAILGGQCPRGSYVARPLRGNARARRRYRPPVVLAHGGWAA